MKKLHAVSFVLLVIGGLNWLLVGIFAWDIGSLFGGQAAVVSRIVYILVGLSAIYIVSTHKKDCKDCCATAPSNTQM
ncbi:DUF378 domain-containing protein [bacterium]|nr:DUF378 domain-containing protein [bacterium]